MRYRFFLSHILTHDSESIEFCLDNQIMTLVAKEQGVKLNATNEFVLLAKGFSSEEKALYFGKRIRNALKLTSVFACIGIDVGKDKATSSFAKVIKDQSLEKDGVAWHDDVHGLLVYNENQTNFIPNISIKGSVSFSPEKFIRDFEKAFASSTNLNTPDELELPINLYCASGMEKSHLAKFILALSAIEFIAKRPSRPEEEMRLISTMRSILDTTNASDAAKKNIIEVLDNMKKMSIGRACRELIKKVLPNDYDEFCRLSDYRGKIAHPSEDHSELPAMAFNAQLLTGRLITRIIEEVSPENLQES